MPRFYAVAFGYRPGIYRELKNARKQVHGYSRHGLAPVHGSFGTLSEAQVFMREHREFPPGICTPFPPAPQTPLPPWDLNPLPAQPLPAPEQGYIPMINIAPPNFNRDEYATVLALEQRIAGDPENMILDPGECEHSQCCYGRGDLRLQRFLLMRRLFQINAALGDLRDRGIQYVPSRDL